MTSSACSGSTPGRLAGTGRALREEVAAQMNEDVRRLARLIQLGVDGGQLAVGKPDSAALQIMSLVDALSIQSAIRGTFDYTDVRILVTAVTEQILGLRLRP